MQINEGTRTQWRFQEASHNRCTFHPTESWNLMGYLNLYLFGRLLNMRYSCPSFAGVHGKPDNIRPLQIYMAVQYLHTSPPTTASAY